MPASLGARPLPMRFGPGVSPMATLHLRLRSPAYSALRILRSARRLASQPLLNSPGAGPQFASMTPWVLTRPSLFRLPPPPAWNSAQFAADLAEITSMGVYSGSQRTDDQSKLALFWAGNTALYWNRIAVQLSTN